MGSRNNGAPETQRPCARLRDADRHKRSASGDPAMVLMCWMVFIPYGLVQARAVEPSTRATDTCPSSPSRRSAAGRTLGFGMNSFAKNASKVMPRCEPSTVRTGIRMVCSKAVNPFFETTRKRAQCARIQLNDECCAFRAAPCNAPRLFS